MPHDPQPLDLDEIEARAAGLYEYATGLDAAWQDEADILAGTDVPQMAAEIRRLRVDASEQQAEIAKLIRWHGEDETAMKKMRGTIERLRAERAGQRAYEQRLREQHDLDVAELNRLRAGLATAREQAITDVGNWLSEHGQKVPAYLVRTVDIPTAVETLVVADDSDEMAASLRRDGFGDDEIANILGPGVTDGDAPEPTLLRWGLDDVMWGDDDSVTVLLSGPAGEPYWLELDPERATALRENLAGPDEEETHVVADDSDDPEHVDDCPGCETAESEARR
ncbi:hypothetical protein [Streptomyces rubradiris]|uniref:Uncharacterized protein n=1 Tax=Streptomyces rubradiris TaxID=285531 RepID=A0ABQ3R3D9_STRRR|nr:hypothetical protein [Streptomyces rubradiris]GHH30060.1 hypothetical protein GCM10018792_76000 [Streptomyces rubradiris]GHI50381.1 hypothetical protein Srubr_02270 [Streptomyces rubradiris]